MMEADQWRLTKTKGPKVEEWWAKEPFQHSEMAGSTGYWARGPLSASATGTQQSICDINIFLHIIWLK